MKRLKRIGPVLFLILGIGSALAAQDPLILLEKAIYAEETLGNLNEAIGLYQQIIADAEAARATSALALFRLGLCYEKTGSTEQAQAAFAKLLKQFPDQQDLVDLIPLWPSNRLDLRPAPWADGEELRLAIKFKGGLRAGELFYRFKSATEYGKTVWNVESSQNTGAYYSSVLADAATFVPIRSYVKEGSYTGREYRAQYSPQQVEWTMKLDGAITKKTFPIAKTIYDGQQLIQILRCLPLWEGFQLTVPVFLSNSTSLVEAKIAVVAKEMITVPAGTFDCYRTVLTRGNETVPSVYWISDDAHAYIVKISESRLLGGTVRYPLDMELISIGAEKQAGQPVM